jgi:hypothetical protein
VKGALEIGANVRFVEAVIATDQSGRVPAPLSEQTSRPFLPGFVVLETCQDAAIQSPRRQDIARVAS